MLGKSLHDFEPNSVAVAAQLPFQGRLGQKKPAIGKLWQAWMIDFQMQS